MNEFIESDNSDIQETVRDFLDELLDCVVAESNRIEQLRDIAQQVVDELIRETVDARDNQNSGAGDVDIFGARIHNHRVLNPDQRQTVEGQSHDNTALQIVFNSQHVTSHLNRSSSVTLLSTCFRSNKVEPTVIKLSSSRRSLPTCTFNQEQQHSDTMSNSQSHCSQSDELPSASEHIAASNFTEEIRKYPTYEETKTVKTSPGVIRVYCNGELDDAELDRILSESKRILYTRKQNDKIAKKEKKERKKKGGVCSRVRKFFRRVCCCSVPEEEDEDNDEAEEGQRSESTNI